MLSVKLDTLWYDDAEPAIKGINEATSNVLAYTNSPYRNSNQLRDVLRDIYDVCKLWATNTYVGRQKPDDIREAFQSFFEALMAMLIKLKDSPITNEQDLSALLLYQGTVYRYLGTEFFSSECIIPKYNDVYVSWSKKPRNSYFESKLLSPITWMACEIKEPRYGLNLAAIYNLSGEQEVVFPTIQECITQIEYRKEEEYDEDC